MGPGATHSTPLLHVADIERSIRFYQFLGFRTIDTQGATPLGWARLHCNTGDIMFLRAERPIDPRAQGFLFYLYTPDLVSLREHLLSNGIAVSAIKHPEYMPSGTVNLSDPDGYHIEIAHWGQSEQEAWERRLATSIPRR
jgi:catechol 2,3-dioxygenase-like lactoylglutathione lyase family enzyme